MTNKHRVDFSKQRGTVICAHCGEFGKLELYTGNNNGRNNAAVVHARTEEAGGMFNHITDVDECRWNHAAIRAGQLPTRSASAKRRIDKWLKDSAAERERHEQAVRRIARRGFIDEALVFVREVSKGLASVDLSVDAHELLGKIDKAEADVLAKDAERFKDQNEPKVYSKRPAAKNFAE